MACSARTRRCRVPALDDYLHKYAAQQNAMGISTVFVWVDDAAPSKILIGYAVDRYLHARSIVGACAQLVDAKDEKAKWFFERYGFASCVDTPMTLYLALG